MSGYTRKQVAETLRSLVFPSLAAGVAETNFVARKQEMFLSQVKNIFAFRTQILLPNLVFKFTLQKSIY